MEDLYLFSLRFRAGFERAEKTAPSGNFSASLSSYFRDFFLFVGLSLSLLYAGWDFTVILSRKRKSSEEEDDGFVIIFKKRDSC